jgi:HK97 family phage portal protein
MIKEMVQRWWPAKAQYPISGTEDPRDWFVAAITYGETDTGIEVDGYTVLKSGPVWQAVNTIAGDIGRLALNVERENGEEDRRHPAWRLLRRQPNEEQLAISFKETLQAWALLWGNGCAYIDRNARGEPAELIPLRPDRTVMIRERGSLMIEYTQDNGDKEYFHYHDVFHVSGIGDATWGYKVWELSQNTTGHNLALQKHGNRQFKNDSRPSGVLEKEGVMSPKGRENLRREWTEIHQGLDNAGKIALLQEGVTFKATQMANGDSQWIEARKFSREEIAAWFCLPPHKVGAMENASVRANLEEQNRDYWNSALSRWATKWEQEAERKLLSRKQQESGSHQVRFDLGDLIRGDSKTRSEGYARARQWGWLSVNEIRKREGLPTIGPDGDTYLTLVNMTDDPSGAPAGKQNTAPPAEPPEPPEPQEDDQQPSSAIRKQCRHLLKSRLDELCQIKLDRLPAVAARESWERAVPEFYERTVFAWREKLSPVMALLLVAGCANDEWQTVVERYLDESLRAVVSCCAQAMTKPARTEQTTLVLDSFGPRRADLVDTLMEN